MPIYEYQCSNCQHTFDLMQKFHENPVKQCPRCLKDTAVRLVSAPSFRLAGTGWYETDFKKPKPSTESSSNDTTKSANTAANNTEAKD